MEETESSTASVDIFEAKDSPTTRHEYIIRVVSQDGAPVGGADVLVTLEGSGSLAGNFAATETRRETNAAGEARVGWYRRSIFGRDLKACLVASVNQPGCQVSLEETQFETADTSYNLPKRPLRF